MKRLAVLCALLALAAPAVQAGQPGAVGARVVAAGGDRYHFAVNIAHDDDSWEHFVDRWEIIGENRKVLATDDMYYPRIEDDIVFRLIRGVKVDPGTEYVIYRLHDRRHGFGREKLVRMPTAAQPDTGWQ